MNDIQQGLSEFFCASLSRLSSPQWTSSAMASGSCSLLQQHMSLLHTLSKRDI